MNGAGDRPDDHQISARMIIMFLLVVITAFSMVAT
jgi:hypothetical protein